jgi:hypothetical protein
MKFVAPAAETFYRFQPWLIFIIGGLIFFNVLAHSRGLGWLESASIIGGSLFDLFRQTSVVLRS